MWGQPATPRGWRVLPWGQDGGGMHHRIKARFADQGGCLPRVHQVSVHICCGGSAMPFRPSVSLVSIVRRHVVIVANGAVHGGAVYSSLALLSRPTPPGHFAGQLYR
jgi:hypothetical protein